ncbi:hypothetical protein BFP70_01340 [Thioclava sp. SK-1]|uniref:hypothetical protein n=1 Tax=Thioclava sp. SK-1 TaxID=1889770 RepID=UPI0008248503|nr:hypothetical protein [Thioclava sp. SK-1]OCX64189.1 hypothetical protein BFP70_01340 [Thioclava sp. SK-1]
MKTIGTDELCRSLGFEKKRLELAYSRGHLAPPEGAMVGRRRMYTLHEALPVAAFFQLSRLLPAAEAGRHARRVFELGRSPAFLCVLDEADTQEEDIISRDGRPGTRSIVIGDTSAHVVAADELAEWLDESYNPEPAVVLSLDQIHRQVARLYGANFHFCETLLKREGE